MLKLIFAALDEAIDEENTGRCKSDNPQPLIKPCTFEVLGQFALIEAKISHIATRDIDAKTNADVWIKERFNQLLRDKSFVWDPHSHEIKMPKETQYDPLFFGKNVVATIAQPEYVLISKALYAAMKNRGVFEEYFAAGPSKKFLDLAKQYKIDLKTLIGN